MDTSPTALFDSYEQDFKQIVASIRDKVDGDGAGERGEQRKAALRRVEMELDEADEMVSQMEIELQGMPQSIRASFGARARSAKAELGALKARARELHAQGARAALLSDAGGSPFRDAPDDDGGAGGDRVRLLAGTERLEGGSRRLQGAQRVALETEDLGAGILRDLRQQREQIENARDTLNTADSSLDRASGTLKKMIRSMYKQRVVTAAIIVVLIVLIAVILWEKLSK
ncbi:vesicle transport v-snare protein vti1 [Phellopilus nigrolimitatus]|nr:vesicle transport v-snare protein vti1 [Phellopilus nigrolimitatus]KAH8111146.1 vesicle transport v-snare protein vti1 [Phellopilus nigrolimitatus]